MDRRFQYPRHYVNKKGKRNREVEASSSAERPGGISTESRGGFSCETQLGHSSIITPHSLSLSHIHTKKKQSVVSCGSPVNETPSRSIVMRLSSSSAILSVCLNGPSLQRRRIFWDASPFNPAEVHLQSRRHIPEATNFSYIKQCSNESGLTEYNCALRLPLTT
jgi:hypothetical protein